MSDRDELMLEKQKIKGAESYLAPAQITATEIATGAIGSNDITDLAVTKEKIAAAFAGDGIAGGAGTALSVDVDNATLTNNSALGLTKIGIKANGIVAASLAANTKGAGLVAGAGTAFAVDVDTTTTEINTNKVRVVDAAITKAKLSDGAKRHVLTVQLPAFTANTTVRCGLLACQTANAYTITKAEVACLTVPIDADGTCLVRVVNYDVSDAADEEICAPWDTEGLVGGIGTALNVTVAPAGINTLAVHDYLYVELINNSVGIDQNWAGATLTIEYTEV